MKSRLLLCMTFMCINVSASEPKKKRSEDEIRLENQSAVDEIRLSWNKQLADDIFDISQSCFGSNKEQAWRLAQMIFKLHTDTQRKLNEQAAETRKGFNRLTRIVGHLNSPGANVNSGRPFSPSDER